MNVSDLDPCPRCGSKSLTFLVSVPWHSSIVACKDCGYRGSPVTSEMIYQGGSLELGWKVQDIAGHD
jgi:C4-type Zn-finger protein